jgi:hypothetical protein
LNMCAYPSLADAVLALQQVLHFTLFPPDPLTILSLCSASCSEASCPRLRRPAWMDPAHRCHVRCTI